MQHQHQIPFVNNNNLSCATSCSAVSRCQMIDNYDQHPKQQQQSSYPVPVDMFIKAAIDNDIKAIDHYCQAYNMPVDATDKSGNPALMYACRNGNVNVVRRLIELGSNVDYQEPRTFNTALHYAAQCGHTRTAEVLILAGHADRTIKNRDGKTPYQLACAFGHGNNKIMKSLFVGGGCDTPPATILRTSRMSAMSHYSSSSSLTDGLGSIDFNNNNTTNVNNNYNNNHQHQNRNGGEQQHKNVHHHQHHHHNHQNGESGSNGSKSAAATVKKNLTFLPSPLLLERFHQHGCYRLVGDGYGFALLAKNGPVQEMIQEAADNLGIHHTDLETLLETLANIGRQFQDMDHMLKKEYELIDSGNVPAATTTTVATAAAAAVKPEDGSQRQQRLANVMAYKVWRGHNYDKIVMMIEQIVQWKKLLYMETYFRSQLKQQQQQLPYNSSSSSNLVDKQQQQQQQPSPRQ